MNKVKPKTKEQTIYFLVSNLSLGTYDKKFLNNLEAMNITLGKPLTTNQAALLDKIILRYARQLKKLEIGADELISLPWVTEPIKSSPQFTEVHLYLVDDEIILRSPYKKDFVKDFRSLEVSSVWYAEDKFWRMPANTYTLKQVKTCLEKHYSKINYCENLQTLFANTIPYNDIKCWDPTLYSINNNLMIVCLNEALDIAIKDIKLDYTLSCLYKLTRYGIQIHESVINNLQGYTKAEIDFALEYNPKIERNDTTLLNKIKLLQPDIVVLATGNRNYDIFPHTKNELIKNNILCEEISFSNHRIDTSNFKFPIVITNGLHISNLLPGRVGKVVSLVNSNPIDIK